jgi:hypothetical protein
MFKEPDDKPCNQVGSGCKAPPAIAGYNTRAECFACGLPVCTNPSCSKRIQWYRYGRRRVCVGCIKDRDRVERQAA